jgi:hypothetical protein
MRAQGAAADRSVPELRPAWWVLRGPVVALAMVVVWERRHYGGGRVPLAAVLDSVTLFLTVAAIAVSVRLGRRSVERPAFSSAANAVGLLAIAAILAWTTPSFAREASYAPSLGPPGVLTAPDGHPVFNVYPFSADGSPLDNVLLYDQDGQPLKSGAFVSEDGSQAPPKYPPDANGNPVVNAYPRQAPSPGPVAPARRPAVRIPPPIPTTTTPPAG